MSKTTEFTFATRTSITCLRLLGEIFDVGIHLIRIGVCVGVEVGGNPDRTSLPFLPSDTASWVFSFRSRLSHSISSSRAADIG
jgi:hypothetical protein